MGDNPAEDIVEKVARLIYANVHHLMRTGGWEAKEAYDDAARAIIAALTPTETRK